ncbi:PorV/PorQ family protein [Breznakiellaceae bacterium SP9]
MLPGTIAGEEKSIEPFLLPSARFAAMGGIHAALTDDFYSIFTNPAAFVGIEEQFSAAELSVSMYGPVLELIDLAQNSDDMDISGLVDDGGFAAGLDIGGPFSLGWVGQGIGMGVFNRTKADAVVTGTQVRPVVFEDILLLTGYSFRFLDKGRHTLDAGFMGKGFFRGALNIEGSVFKAAEVFNDPKANEFNIYLGMGLDLGLRYTRDENLVVALVCRDAFSPVQVTSFDTLDDFIDKKPSESTAHAIVDRKLDVGVLYRIHSEFLDRYVSSFVVAADYHDILDLFSLIPRNPILNFGVGVEVKLMNVLSLRVGLADALPAMGFGLDFSIFRFDCAMYGKERGLDPGVQSVYALDVSLKFVY